MSEALSVCKALAAMVRDHGEPTEEEVRFVGHAALDLGLSPEENEEVQRVLAGGGDYFALIGEVESRPMRLFLFRRVVSAALLDERITDAEERFILATARAFGYPDLRVGEFIGWVRQGIAWERAGAELAARMCA